MRASTLHRALCAGAVLTLILFVAACGEDPADGGGLASTNKDVGGGDITTDIGGAVDTAAPIDTGAPVDVATVDSGAPDTGSKADASSSAPPTMCNPCKASSDCGTFEGAALSCVNYTNDGGFCATSCSSDSDCAAGYVCKNLFSVEGKSAAYCVVPPSDAGAKHGACTCSDDAIAKALSTTCYVEGKLSGKTVKCAGTRTCGSGGLSACDAKGPNPEFCNGLDDNCDGQTDEPPAADICGDSNPCWIGSCEDGKCKQTNKSGACDADGDACTNDQCEDGQCKAGAQIQCDDKNPCTLDTCDAGSGECKSQPHPDGFLCDDGDPCTASDKCAAGKCAGGAAKCDDANACTDDSCGDSGCTHKINNNKCEDGDKCTDGDKCAFGKCSAGAAKACDDDNVCTADACDSNTGDCKSTPQDDACDDGNKCTAADTCKAGKCTGTAKDCDDKNLCTTDKCDPAVGCTFDLNSAPCDDSDACTDFDKCAGGKCAGAAKGDKACEDGNPCTKDACDIAVGCTSTNSDDTCDDGNPCTAADSCKDGKCEAGTFVCKCQKDSDCQQPTDKCLGTLFCDKSANSCKVNPASVVSCTNANDTECAVNKCDPKTGGCAMNPINESKPCDADGDLCTAGDACVKGACTKGKALVCDDQNPCTNDACLPKSGCSNTVNAAACDADGNACTEKDTCANKVCVAGPAKSCDDGDKCTTDACDAKTGKCTNAAIFGCGGLCSEDKHCDDGEPCTDDSCKAGKCASAPKTGKCDDGDVCTSEDACADGKCGGKKKDCNDSNNCTNDGCDPKTGCVLINNTAPCDDFDACTLGDTCEGGKCAKSTAKNCDDKDKCTTDQCNPGDGACVHKPVPGCGGNCTATSDCDDKEPCSKEKCTQGKCDYEDLTGACDDGDQCTTGESCTKGKCGGGKPKDCSDGNACTLDACDKVNAGCTNTPIKKGEACDDGNSCTDKTTCVEEAGKLVCKGSAKNCDDGNVCTNDACDPKSGGCTKTNNTSPCEDGNACTAGDMCNGGACVTGKGLWIDTLAGSTAGSVDGKGAAAKLTNPIGATLGSKGAVLGATNAVFVTEAGGHRIRKVTADGSATTFAGSSKAGLLDGTGTAAWFNWPAGIDSAGGKLYVADRLSHAVRVVTDKAVVTTLAGNGSAGGANGDLKAARFDQPWGIAASAGGVVYVAEYAGHKIRKIAGNSVSTLAGAGAGYVDGKGAAARFRNPMGLALDAVGNLWVADYSNHRIRRVAPDGVVTTAAGSGAGFLDGGAATAKFRNPWALAVDSQGRLLVGDRYNHRIRLIDGGVVSTVTGANAAIVDGLAAQARFNQPAGLVVDGSGYLYVADYNNHRVRRARDSSAPCAIGGVCYAAGAPDPSNACQLCDAKTSASKWSNVKDGAPCLDNDLCTSTEKCASGSCKGVAATCDDSDKCTTDSCDKGTGACVFAPIVGCGGNCGKDTDCDDKNPCTDNACTNNKCAFTNSTKPCDDGDPCTAGDACTGGKCVPGDKTWVSTLAGGTKGFADGKGSAAKFNVALGVKHDGKGGAWVADTYNHRIRHVAADGTTTTFAGTGKAGITEGPTATSQFNRPYDLVATSDGSIYVADGLNHRIRKIDSKGSVSTFAGGVAGYVNGKGAGARFNLPVGIAAGSKGTLYVAEYNNNRVRRVAADGTVTLLAGGSYGFANGTGDKALFRRPWGIDVLPNGDVIVGDYANHRIRQITPSGVVTTLAGTGAQGLANGPANQSTFRYPRGVSADSAGNIYIADRNNNRLRKINPQGFVTTFAGIGASTPLVDGDATATARIRLPTGVSATPGGQVIFVQEGLESVRSVWDSAKSCSVGGACYSNGVHNPAKACERCDGDKSRKAWSPAADGSGCDDGNLCTGGDVCAAGKCGGKATNCDDSDKCTADSCDAGTGACVNKPIIGCDGYCASNGDCDDKNVCTTDTCSNNKCAYSNNTAACDDGNACSQGDICAAGKCTEGTATHVLTGPGGGAGFKDGPSKDARFNQISGMAWDVSGGLYIVDRNNHRVRKLNPTGTTVTTFAGSTVGYHDDKASVARFNLPEDIVLTADGSTWYVADRGNHRIRKIDKDGNVTTLAGSTSGFADGKAGAARFSNPYGIGVGSKGVVYVADYSNRRIRRVDADGTVTTLAGSGGVGMTDGPGATATFRTPIDVAAGPNGNLYVTDYTNHAIRRVSATGVVTTLAGNGAAGSAEGTGKAARFRNPRHIAWSPDGTLVVTDQGNHRLRGVTLAGATSFIAGVGAGLVDGDSKVARFNTPVGVAVAANGYIAVGDRNNHRMRLVRITDGYCKIGAVCWTKGVRNPGQPCLACDASKSKTAWSTAPDKAWCADGDLCTSDETCTSGKCVGKAVTCDDGNKCTADACDTVAGGCSHKPIIGCDGYCEKDADCDDGNPCTLGHGCNNNKCAQGPTDWVSTVAGAGSAGKADGAADKATFNTPWGLGTDGKGVWLVADYNNNIIRKVAANGTVSTLAGSGKAGLVDGKGTAAWFNRPADIAFDSKGVGYVADRYTHSVRKILADGTVSTWVGSGATGTANGKGGTARFNQPVGLAMSATDTLIVADYANNRIRKVLPDGTVSTIAGSSYGFADGKGAAARFRGPIGVAIDGAGTVYVADHVNHRIRRITPDTTVTTFAGTGSEGVLDGSIKTATFNRPFGVGVDSAGNVFVTDRSHHVRMIHGVLVETIAGSAYGHVDGAALNARFRYPYHLRVDVGGTIWVADSSNHRLRKVERTASACHISGVCYAKGTTKPGDTCSVCDGSKAAKAWTPSTAPECKAP